MTAKRSDAEGYARDEQDIPANDPYWDDDSEEEEDDTPDYYLCTCCGYTTKTHHGAWGCPRCTAIMEPEYY